MTVPPRLRVLITRAAHQSSELANRLRDLGAEPILIPTIEIVEPHSYAALDGALANLSTFQWVLFTSPNAVLAFQRRIGEHHPRLSWRGRVFDSEKQAFRGEGIPEEEKPRVAAIGISTARALEGMGLSPDLVPPKAVAESFGESLLPHAGGGARFLLIRAETARDHLPETLRASGAEVVIAPAYRTVIPEESVTSLRALFAEQESWPDAITFTSSSTVTNLLALLESASLTLPEGILRASIGPITSQTLREVGYPPHVEAPEATTASLAETLIAKCRQ